MPPIEVDLWRQVNLDERVWASFHADHKMGWIHPGDIVHLVEKYKENWYRIDPEDSQVVDFKPPHDVTEPSEPPYDYSEYWVKDNDLGLFGPVSEPDPEPGPGPEPEPELSWLQRIINAIVGFLLSFFRKD